MAKDLMAGAGFVRATAELRHRVVMSVDGLERTGKTDFALSTAPDPIVLIPTDKGLEGVIQKYQRKRRIYVPKGAEEGYHFEYDPADEVAGQSHRAFDGNELERLE